MRQINRQKLTEFFKEIHLRDRQEAEDEEDEDMEMEEDKESWADENLDEEIKAFLKVYDNGKDMPVDVVSHLEYFYNTLECNYRTVNPFENLFNFTALLYREPSSPGSQDGSHEHVRHKTLFEKHRVLIFPTSSDSSKSDRKSVASSSPGNNSVLSPGNLNIGNQFSMNTLGSSQ